MGKLFILYILILANYYSIYSQGFELWGTGVNYYGQTGLSSSINNSRLSKLMINEKWLEIISGYEHTLGLNIDGSVWAWGHNDFGQLGINSLNNSFIPIKIDSSNDWKSISCGYKHSFGIKKDGSLWAWGNNEYGQLGDSTILHRKSPIRVGNNNDWKFIEAGMYHSVAIKNDGSLWVWGRNSHGQLGLGDNFNRMIPTKLNTSIKWKVISAAAEYTIALDSNDYLWGWGKNYFMKSLDSNDIYFENYILSPRIINQDNDWKIISANYYHNAALKHDGTLWIWGDNYFKQTGINSDSISLIPRMYNKENDWLFVITGPHNTMAIKKDGSLWGIGCGSFPENTINYNIDISPTMLRYGNTNDWQSVSSGLHFNIALRGRYKLEATITTDKQNNEICIGDSIQLNAVVTQGVPEYKYKWTPSNLVSNDTMANPMAYPKKNTNFKVEITDAKEEKKILSVNVIVNDYPVINIISIDTICQGEAFTAIAIGGKEYKWYKDSVSKNILSTTNILTQRPTQNTKYIVEGNNYKCSSYDTINITVLPKTKAEIGLLGSLSLCQGDSVMLFIKDKLPSVDYEWIVNNTKVNADTIIAKTPQKYKLIVRNKTLSGCIDSTEIEVTEQVKEKLVINGIKSFCEGDSTKLEISKPFPGVQFVWNTGEQTNSIIVNKAGTYWCKAINNNCLTVDTIQVTTNLKPVINITGDTTICKNATGVLTLNGTYTSCTWSSGATTPSITITKAGIYSAQAENEFGCKTTAQFEVKEISNNIDLSKFQDIDFGKTKINESITKELDMTGINPSNIKLLNNTDFTFVRNGNKLEITFKAAKKGSSEDSLFIEIDKPCQETIALKLKAEAEGEQIITLKVADIEVLAGDTDVPLPITYKLNEGVSLPQTITWTAKLNYKTAIYYPEITGDVQSANRNIDILLSGTKTLTKKEDTLTIIKGKTYIADTIYTKVNFIDFTVNPDFTIIKEDGSIKITGLCVPHLRGIEFFTPTTMIIKPNPSNGEVDIEFTSEENGDTKLKLYNSAGAEVLTDSKNKKDKAITFHFDKLDLPNGIYQAQIEQSGKIVQSTSLVIEK